jgi:hypothetical protein
MGRLFTYVITNDFGFAPNPFHGTLTLNTCKPDIRREAEVGDWVAANTAADFPADRRLLVYAMQVTQKMSMAEYDLWARENLPEKIPSLRSRSYERRAGDAQYDFTTDPPTRRVGFHAPGDMATDLQGGHTLLSEAGEFYYFGGQPVAIPDHLRPVIKTGRKHKSDLNDAYVEAFVRWLRSFYEPGIHGWPHKAAPQGPQRVALGPTQRKVGR